MGRIIRPTVPDLIIPHQRVRRPVSKRSERLMAPTFYIAGNERFRGAVFPSPGVPSPSDIFGSNLVAWYGKGLSSATAFGAFSDTGATTPSTNGGALVVWTDQSGNGFTLEAVGTFDGGAVPTYTASGINGQPSLVCTASGPAFVVNAVVANGTVGNQFKWPGAGSPSSWVVWVVFQYNGTAAGSFTLSSLSDVAGTGDSAVTDGIRIFNGGNVSSGTTTGICVWNGNAESSSHTFTVGTPYAFSVVFNGTVKTTYLGNATPVNDTWAIVLANTPFWFTIGGQSSGATNGWPGLIGEVVLAANPTAGQLTSLQTWGNSRWGT